MEISKEKQLITFVNEIPSELHYIVKEGERLVLNMANLSKAGSDINLVVDIENYAYFLGAFADLSDISFNCNVVLNLNGEGAEADWHLASLSSNHHRKKFVINVNHNIAHTRALTANYGIAKDKSNLVFTGVSAIEHDAKKSSTRQEAKIIVFDKESDGKASPILKINDNDVMASHAAVIGKLNEEHLFYLKSRGLDEDTAKRLIIMGYLKPIVEFFDDEKLANKISDAIEGGIVDA